MNTLTPPVKSRTLYRPVHSDGRKGPEFFTMTEAAIWILQNAEERGWTTEPAGREPTLLEIQEALSKGAALQS